MSRADDMVVCALCLRCRHPGVIDAGTLALHGYSPDVTLAELSRRVRCAACNSKAVRLERRPLAEAAAFIAE